MAQRRSRTPPRKPLSKQTQRESKLDRIRSAYTLRQLSRRALLKKSEDSHALLGASRPVLVPLHPNLRRLPSRFMAPFRSRQIFDAPDDVVVGSKRKRHGSNNENSNFLRQLRCGGRFKRQRSQNDSSDEDFAAARNAIEMNDAVTNQSLSSDISDEEAEEPLLDDSDEFLINEAANRQLNRLRKDELVRLHGLAGLATTEDMTKSELINGLISARVDTEEVPPSSPSGKTDADYSSDEGHYGGGEETDAANGSPRNNLRRRATVQELSRPSNRTVISRTLSLGIQDSPHRSGNSNKKSARIADDVKSPIHHAHTIGHSRRRPITVQSSPSYSSNPLPSPPATRLRSRTISNEHKGLSTPTSASSSSKSASETAFQSVSISSPSHKKRLQKAKHVDFEAATLINDGSGNSISNMSPRRLRSNGRGSTSSNDIPFEDTVIVKRVTPMRKAKKRIVCLKEDSTATESDEEEDAAEHSDEEIDQLDSSPSPGASPEPRQHRMKDQRTPLKKRLRPRKFQTLTPPSDGDDEEEEEEDAGAQDVGDDGADEHDDEDLATERNEDESDEEVDEEGIILEPRVLRNGKVVGDTELDVPEEAPEEADEADEDADDGSSTSEIEIDGDSDTATEELEEADEVMEDEFDLSSATQKALIRLRRDDLVKLCESRDLEAEGTKPQLAQALLEWRDSQEISTSSAPSSSSTARPPSITRHNGRRPRTRSQSKSSTSSPPVLMRSNRVHEDEPVTPPLSKEKRDAEGDLELDLESLGLEDREIPPDKLTKLEKIGSGGFKDVFIGKFRGRKVAIAEFRDQLSAMDIKELKLLAEFAHPNIVRFLGVSIPENTRETPVMIISELCANGDLFDYVRNVPAQSLYRVLSIMLDIARGVQYLHDRKPSVIHRDCKSSNILITSKGTAKIADFGLAKVKQSTRSMVRSLVGTVNWQAPELWAAHPKYNHKVDVFSCACVFWEMLQWHIEDKKYPWEGMNEHGIYEAVGQKRLRPSLHGLRRQWCPEIVDLIDRMWAQNHQDRPGMAEVVEEIQDIIKKYR